MKTLLCFDFEGIKRFFVFQFCKLGEIHQFQQVFTRFSPGLPNSRFFWNSPGFHQVFQIHQVFGLHQVFTRFSPGLPNSPSFWTSPGFHQVFTKFICCKDYKVFTRCPPGFLDFTKFSPGFHQVSGFHQVFTRFSPSLFVPPGL